MLNFNAFPKIFTLGDRHIHNIFEDEVEITEKLDGSQFAFGMINGELKFRSKGRVFEVPDKMFEKAVERIKSINPDSFYDGMIYYGEYLNKPKHNVLEYKSIPIGGISLFGALNTNGNDNCWVPYSSLQREANELGLDVVPLLYKGSVLGIDQLTGLLETESYLGGPKIEGFVVKNYHKKLIYGDREIIKCGKFVSEAFKEVQKGTWKSENTGKGQWEVVLNNYKTEARWNKALQHLKEKGVYTGTPKDIGPLVQEVQKDLKEEEQENIKEQLWKIFGKEVIQKSTRGLPEWYKLKLANESFDGGNSE